MTTIVVPLDGSSFSEAAIHVATTIARRRQGRVELIRVVAPDAQESCDDYLQVAAARITDAPVSHQVVELDDGEHVADAIRRHVDPDPNALVCMTAHGRSGLGAALLGTTTEAVIAQLGRPVLVVGPHCSPTWAQHRHLVIPLDGSGRAERILPYAAAVSRAWDLDPWLVQIAHPFDNEVAQHAEHVLERPERELRAQGLEPRTDFQWASNVPASIAGQARVIGASLILMSSYVPTGVARTLLGSVTMGVIHRAPCPVLVCPPDVLSGPISDQVPLVGTGADQG